MGRKYILFKTNVIFKFAVLFRTLSALQTDTYTNAISADSDEMAQNELSHQELHCLLVFPVID